MPYYPHTTPARESPGMHEHTVHAVHKTPSAVAGPAEYRPQVVPSARGQPGHQSCQQQQQRHRQHQYQHVQARPTHQALNKAASHVPQRRQNEAVASAVTALLPYCTAEIPLNEEQVIAVTDVVGSLKELVLLTLGAKDGDEECMSRLESALGSEQAVAGVLDFFSAEFAIE